MGIVGFQMVGQRIERHGRSREIRNVHVLARTGTLDVSDLTFILDKPVVIMLALLAYVLERTAAYAVNDRPPSEGRRRKTGMSDSTLVIRIAALPSHDRKLKCKDCHEADVVPRKGRWRRIRCHDVGRMRCYVEVEVRRLRCRKCGHKFTEHLPFLTSDKARVTRAFEWHIVDLRSHMSISEVADHLGIDWETVKNAEKRVLEAEYKTIDLKGVRRIGIDEIYVFHLERSNRKYVTVVRDLDTGRVLSVTRGKGEAALKMFAHRLRRQKAVGNIVCVTMDMSNAYFGWVAGNLPNAKIVFDHFHVIKMMNEHLNNIRRMAMAHANAEAREKLAELAASDEEREKVARLIQKAKDELERAKKILKGNMILPLMNAEDIVDNPKAKARLDRMLAKYEDLGKAYSLKESLRSAYATAKTVAEATKLFNDWIEEAESSGVADLRAMAKTIRTHLDGILGFWEFRGASNASVEGFNNKIRWLIKQAYGYRDFKYFRLKVIDLPNLKLRTADY